MEAADPDRLEVQLLWPLSAAVGGACARAPCAEVLGRGGRGEPGLASGARGHRVRSARHAARRRARCAACLACRARRGAGGGGAVPGAARWAE